MLKNSNIIFLTLIACLLGGLIELKAQEIDSEQLLGTWGVDVEAMQPIWEAGLKKMLEEEPDEEVKRMLAENRKEITLSMAEQYFILEKEGVMVFGQKGTEKQQRGAWRLEGDMLLMMFNLDAAEVGIKIITFEPKKRLVLQPNSEQPDELSHWIAID